MISRDIKDWEGSQAINLTKAVFGVRCYFLENWDVAGINRPPPSLDTLPRFTKRRVLGDTRSSALDLREDSEMCRVHDLELLDERFLVIDISSDDGKLCYSRCARR